LDVKYFTIDLINYIKKEEKMSDVSIFDFCLSLNEEMNWDEKFIEEFFQIQDYSKNFFIYELFIYTVFIICDFKTLFK